MKAFKDALKSFNRKALRPVIKLRAECHMQVFAKEIEACKALEGKQGLIRRTVCGEHVGREISAFCEPGIAVAIKGTRDAKDALQPQTSLRDLLNIGRPSNIDHLLRHPGSFTGSVPAGFQFRDGVLMTEDSDRRSSPERQKMVGDQTLVNGIFVHGATAKRILTGMELDASSDVVTEDSSLQPLADSLRTGRYTAPYTGKSAEEPRYDHRRTLLALNTIAEGVSCREAFSFGLLHIYGDEDFAVKVSTIGAAGNFSGGLNLVELAAEFRRTGKFEQDHKLTLGQVQLITVLTHTLNEEGTGFKFSLLKAVADKFIKERDDKTLAKFNASFRNILTRLGYGDEVRFEVIAPPTVCLGGTRVKVEFICDEPPTKMYEAINPAIFENEWIDCGEIGRIEAKLSEAALVSEIEGEKNKPLATRIVNGLEKDYVGSSDGFLKPDAKVPELRTEITPRAIAEAMWSHVPNIIPKVLQLVMAGSFGTSPTMGKVRFVSHESALALKHREKDGIIMELDLPYEAAYMMFAKEILEEILNTPHFPFYIRDFVQYTHPTTHHDNVIAALAPVIGKILKKKGPLHVTDKELHDLVKYVVAD